MSVSHMWKSTILSFPSLWSVPYLGSEVSPEIVRMFLRRSGGHHLDITIPRLRSEHRVPVPKPKFNRYSHTLDASAHLPRIRKLLVELEGETDMKHLIRIFSEPAPSLTHLKLVAPIRESERVPFPNLFGLEFPKLRVLKILGTGAWPEVVGANLTRITMIHSFDPQLLKRCIPYSPNLKVLKLHGVFGFDRPDLSTWQRITLPPGVCLSVRRSEGHPAILSLFALPPDGHIKVKPSANIPITPLLLYILPADISPLQNLDTLTRLHVKARFNVSIKLELRCFRLDRPALEVTAGYPFVWSRTKDPQMGTSAMWIFCGLDRIVLTGVEELRMDGFVGLLEPHPPELLQFLKRMPALTSVITADGNEEIFRSALNNLGCRAVLVRAGR